jgi:hypothetical protein
MTATEILQTIRHLPEDAQVTLTVRKADLVRALEDRDDRPDRVVTTAWCAETLGMSREWWADQCRVGAIREAFQEGERSPWHLPIGAARRHLLQHQQGRSHSKRRRRGPRTKGRAT